jgi:hypothetical protein
MQSVSEIFILIIMVFYQYHYNIDPAAGGILFYSIELYVDALFLNS